MLQCILGSIVVPAVGGSWFSALWERRACCWGSLLQGILGLVGLL